MDMVLLRIVTQGSNIHSDGEGGAIKRKRYKNLLLSCEFQIKQVKLYLQRTEQPNLKGEV